MSSKLVRKSVESRKRKKLARPGKKPGFHAVYGVLFLLVLFAVFFLHIGSPDRDYSVTEKRALEALPALSFNSLRDGSYMKDAEEYSAEQFPGRDLLMRLRTGFSYVLGMWESNGVYRGRSGQLAERFDEPDPELFEKTAAAVKNFAARHPSSQTSFLLAPTVGAVAPELLPEYAVNADENAYIDHFFDSIRGAAAPIDVRSAFKEAKASGTALYYRTDHHWTTDGAYKAYLEASSVMNFPARSFSRAVVSDDFRGSLAAKSGFYAGAADSIAVYTDTDESLKLLLKNEETGETRASLYYGSALDSADPYELFFGGNYPMLTIESTADSDRTLLVIKDSYANSFLPFLAGSYRKITIIDPRYYSRTVDNLFVLENYDDVLFLYNAGTLAIDSSLYKVLE